MSQRSISVISSFHWIVNLLFPMEKFKQSEQCTLKLFRLMRLRHSGHCRLRCIKTERCNTAEVCRKQLDVVGANYVGTCCAHWICTCKGSMVQSKQNIHHENAHEYAAWTANCTCIARCAFTHAEKNSRGICSERTSSKSSKLKLKRRSNRSSLPSSVSLHSFHHLSLPTTSAMCGGCWGGCRGASFHQYRWIEGNSKEMQGGWLWFTLLVWAWWVVCVWFVSKTIAGFGVVWDNHLTRGSLQSSAAMMKKPPQLKYVEMIVKDNIWWQSVAKRTSAWEAWSKVKTARRLCKVCGPSRDSRQVKKSHQYNTRLPLPRTKALSWQSARPQSMAPT